MSVLQAAQAALGATAAGQTSARPRPARIALVDRMTWGGNQEEWNLYNLMGPAGYIAYHMNYQAIPDSAMDSFLAQAAYNTLGLPAEQFVGLSTSTVVGQLQRAMILRAIYSKRQFYEKMVEFWSDHFNIWVNQDGVQLLKSVDDRDVIRANALGNFGTMLRASAHSPAMLEYLNNDQNINTAPNENYARELMELHTLGVNGGYTQNDVHEVARCFTGWTYWGSSSGVDSYHFRYNSARHDTGQKIVLGNVIPARPAAQGQQDGDDVLNILLAHPSTAQFISTKLLKRFWGYDPPQSHIDLVAAAYTSSGGDIKSMMQVVLALAPSGPLKLKRPLHLLVSAIRALKTKVTSHTSFPASLQTPLVQAGQSPMNWTPPDGYPDALEYWSGGQLSRWNFGADLMNSAYSGLSVDIPTLTAGAVTPAAVAARINTVMFNGAMNATDLSTVTTYLGPGNPNTTKIREGIGLAIGSPSFQWY